MNSRTKKIIGDLKRNGFEDITLEEMVLIKKYIDQTVRSKLDVSSTRLAESVNIRRNISQETPRFLSDELTYHNPYELNPQSQLNTYGHEREYPNMHGRNFFVESELRNSEPTKFPGQKKNLQEMDRSYYLPFNPQNPDNIVWNDMPRGGFSTRNTRLEM